MTIDRDDALWGQPRAGGAYHGFATAAPQPAPAKRAWRVPRTATIVGGVGGAVALGLAFGFLAKPNLGQSNVGTPMRAVTADAAVTQPTMAIEVIRPAPPLPVKSAGKLEVLPPDMVRATPRAVQALSPFLMPATPSPVRLPVTPAPLAVAPPQSAAAGPACAGVRGYAAQIVCADPELAAADQELNRAYRRAMRSGASPDQLRQDQRDWLAVREDAARRSPRAVANIYEQRIDELNQIADDGPG
jgi:uncharacterized protein YecT (DUF1311 family)